MYYKYWLYNDVYFLTYCKIVFINDTINNNFGFPYNAAVLDYSVIPSMFITLTNNQHLSSNNY